MKKLAAIQSNYIPWKGYFDIINMADVFLLSDSMQYTVNDWRNRNLIKTKDGLKWLTIPVRHNGGDKIRDVEVVNQKWRRKHWIMISHAFARSSHFKAFKSLFEKLYLGSTETRLSRINHAFIQAVCGVLGITTELLCELDNPVTNDKNGLIIDLCRHFGADVYLTGPAAKEYIDETLFNQNGVAVEWMDYSGYPEYAQRFEGAFAHGVTVLDLLFNLGPEGARRHMLSFDKRAA